MKVLATTTAWEYRTILAPTHCAFAVLAPLFDKLGNEGWEYVGCFDKDVSIPETPPDLRGEDIAGQHKQNGNGAVLLDRAAAGAQRTILAHHLIFKRPKQTVTAEGEVAE